MKRLHIVLAACLLILPLPDLRAYSVLTHEAIIDSVWTTHIRPLLLQRFPDATPEDLKHAYSYAYGGCLIQDLGYVPFSSRHFSDLTHYVRSGDFVAALIRDSETLDEYAFALGALAHYASDLRGHPTVNFAAGQLYPKLRAKYGHVVTYENNPAAHLKTEFSLDVVQVARGLYAPDALHSFIGFNVSKELLDRAFEDTYGLKLKDVFGTLDLALGTYRFSVGHLIPEMTKVAWHQKRADIEKLSPGAKRASFIYVMPRRRYEKEWGKEYKQPGFGARFLAALFHIIPKFGPLRALGFPPVPNQVEGEFLKSFESTVAEYRSLLDEVKTDRMALTNYNLDTGKSVRPGEYKRLDETYMLLVDKLADQQFKTLNAGLRREIVAFFDQTPPGYVSEKTARNLEAMKSIELAGDDSVEGSNPQLAQQPAKTCCRLFNKVTMP